MSSIAGIDLGTTFSALAILNDVGKPEVIANTEGQHLTPSALYFEDDETILVGQLALWASKEDDSRYVELIKRYMHKPEYPKTILGRKWTPAELSSLILKKLKQECSEQVGEITDAVITVPAHFDHVRRAATMEAGRLAGLNIIGIVNEPTAAALYYATTHDVAGRVVMFDLGGGTFDVTVLDVKGRKIDIVTSRGDHRLGGRNFDEKVLSHSVDEYKNGTGGDLCQTSEDANRCRPVAEETKKRLSQRDHTSAELYGSARPLRVDYSRSEFEEAIAPYLARIEMLVEAALDDAGSGPDDIDHVVLVGGSTRVPCVRERLTRLFGSPPLNVVNVDECVALGAALEAGLRVLGTDESRLSPAARADLATIEKTEVTNHDYGTLCLKDDPDTGRTVLRNDILIPKNTPIPCKVTKPYFTAVDGQETVETVVTETQNGEEDPEFANERARDELRLPPGRPAGQPVDVTYSYDANQIMHCVFKDVESGREKEMDIDAGKGQPASDGDAKSGASVEDFVVE